MANWIKVRIFLSDDPDCIKMAEMLGTSEYAVAGMVQKIWSWASENLTDGNAPSVTETWLDRYVNVTGFAEALKSVNWLERTNVGVRFPKWEKHLSKGAKSRALGQQRTVLSRFCNGPSVTETSLDKIRLDKDSTTTTREAVKSKKSADHEQILAAMESYNGGKLAGSDEFRLMQAVDEMQGRDPLTWDGNLRPYPVAFLAALAEARKSGKVWPGWKAATNFCHAVLDRCREQGLAPGQFPQSHSKASGAGGVAPPHARRAEKASTEFSENIKVRRL